MLHPKGMGLLEIKLKKFRLLSIPFTQIRPFIYGDFSLQDVKGNFINKINIFDGTFLISCIVYIVHYIILQLIKYYYYLFANYCSVLFCNSLLSN